jgi:hypothetical protein
MKLADYTAKKIARAAALARGEDVKPLLPLKNENGKRPLDEEERVADEPVASKRVAGSEATPSKSEEAPAASASLSVDAKTPSDATHTPLAASKVPEPLKEENKVVAQVKLAQLAQLAQLALEFEASSGIQAAATTTPAPANTTTAATANTTIEASAPTSKASASKAPASTTTEAVYSKSS